MLDVPSLERKWFKYKIKSYLPYISIFLLSLITLIGTLIFLKSDNESHLEEKQLYTAKNIQRSSKKSSSEHAVILEPSMQFIQNISSEKENLMPQQSAPNLPASNILPKKSLLTNVEKTITPKALPSTTAFSSSSVTVNTKKPTIIHDNDVFNIKEIEERFRSNSNPHLGLYIARYHYDHADYNEAYNYALKTNSISNTLEESWIVFSKSLVKLGRTDQAKKTLQLYISKSNSEEAKLLLNSIEHGEFK